MRRDVRFGSKADIGAGPRDVRFTLMSVSIGLVERVGDGRFVPLAVRGRPKQR